MSQEIIENAKIIARKLESIMRVLGDERGGDNGGTLASVSYDVVEEAQLKTLTKQIISSATAMMKATSELRLRAMLLEDKELIEQIRSEQQALAGAEEDITQLQQRLEEALLKRLEAMAAAEAKET